MGKAADRRRLRPAALFCLLVAVLTIGCAAQPLTPKTEPTKNFLPTSLSPTALPTLPPAPETVVSPAPTPTAVTCHTPGRVETGMLNSALAGEFAYRVYLPPCYGEDGHVYPTLYMLPGNIHTEAIWDELGLDETAENGIVAGAWPPLVIVMPAGGWLANNSSGGPGSYEALILNELIPAIEAAYCVWRQPKGRALGGLSRGGYWALEIAFRHPEKFVSVGGHSAALLDLYAGPAVNPQQTGLSNVLGELRIYLDIGADDYVIQNVRRLHEEMDTAVPPVPHTWVLNQGRHEEAYWSAHLADYLAWYTAPWQISRDALPECTLIQ